jgi:nucleoid-associated protein EbfC
MSKPGWMGNLGNMGNIMKQAQAMQEQLAKLQAEAATKTAQASAGGGIVTVVANGGMEIVSVKIDPEFLKGNDVEMLQDLVLAATNEALRKAREMVAEEMKGVTGGLQIPGLF